MLEGETEYIKKINSSAQWLLTFGSVGLVTLLLASFFSQFILASFAVGTRVSLPLYPANMKMIKMIHIPRNFIFLG